jgi:hypothetical protein
MAVYFALRVKERRDNESLESAQTYYRQVFSIAKYQQFKEDTDAILVADGYADCIVTIA